MNRLNRHKFLAFMRHRAGYNPFLKSSLNKKFNHIKYLSKWAGIILICTLVTSCISDVWTGANLVYDRHNIYIKVNDFQLAANISRTLYRDKIFKRSDCSIEIAVFNQDVLMVGHVPTQALRQEAEARIQAIPGIKRFYNQLELSNDQENPVLDSWITTTIRGEILADSSIDPHHYKIVTSDQIVYIMGNAMPDQAEKVIHYARSCRGVIRVVKLLKYYHLSDKP